MKNNQVGFRQALEFFRQTSKTVPAYKDFLKKNKINPNKIKNLEDFKKVPLVDKKNYLLKYPFVDLFPNRNIPPMVSASSGSSGQPFYWPRGKVQEVEGGQIHENIFRNIFEMPKKGTLMIVCFSMGSWVAGTYTLSSGRWISENSGGLTTITPGIDKDDVIGALKNFAPNFNQVILAGYPPFLMDVLNDAKGQGIDLHKLKLRLLLAGENFSEKWRDTIQDRAGINSLLNGSVSVYGTADAGILGHETPLSVFIRKKASQDKNLLRILFKNTSFLPSLIQYYPEKKFFESVNGKIVFTAKAGIPLVRYNINDNGEIINYNEMQALLADYKLKGEIKKKKLDVWKQPFIYLSGREDVAVSFYAINIYPENIKAGLEDRRLSKIVSGKFKSLALLSRNQSTQKLIINVELSKGVKPTDINTKLIQSCVVDSFTKLNMEFRKLHASIGEKAKPKIKLIESGTSEFQVKKSKIKWTN